MSEKAVHSTRLFNQSIKQEQNIDELNDYVLQGLCKVEDKYLLSAYDYQHNNNSIIYVLGEDLKKYYIKELDTDSHVGGITYDPVHENVWITDNNGTVSAYSKDDMFNSKLKIESKYKKVFVGSELNNYYGICSAAYITYHDNKLYIGNFNNRNETVIKEYNILSSGFIDTKNYNKTKISEYVQGIAFYDCDDKTYLITSSSYGRFFNSKLRFYDFNKLKKACEISTKPMMEEIIVDDDNLVCLYESNAKVYKNNEKSKDIIITDINKLLTK